MKNLKRKHLYVDPQMEVKIKLEYIHVPGKGVRKVEEISDEEMKVIAINMGGVFIENVKQK